MTRIMFLSNVDGRIIPSGFTDETIPEDNYFETGPMIYFFDPDELDPPNRYMFCYDTKTDRLELVLEMHHNTVLSVVEENMKIAPQFVYFYADLDTSTV